MHDPFLSDCMTVDIEHFYSSVNFNHCTQTMLSYARSFFWQVVYQWYTSRVVESSRVGITSLALQIALPAKREPKYTIL